jgi:hypothetical protein
MAHLLGDLLSRDDRFLCFFRVLIDVHNGLQTVGCERAGSGS